MHSSTSWAACALHWLNGSSRILKKPELLLYRQVCLTIMQGLALWCLQYARMRLPHKLLCLSAVSFTGCRLQTHARVAYQPLLCEHYCSVHITGGPSAEVVVAARAAVRGGGCCLLPFGS